MADSTGIPTHLNIAPRGKSWVSGQLVDGTQGNPTRDGMKQEAHKTLIAHAEGRVQHAKMGLCPDGIEGPLSRDRDCQVCQALMALS